ncbi:MAG: SusC/RagA family TonB-linked outer membrane protein [Balneolales bacterium]
MKYKLLVILCMSFSLYGTGLAQAQIVEGTVSDAELEDVLPGVNIQVEGTNVGTTTNPEGEYSIEVEGPGDVLVFSYVGYITEEIIVGDRDVIDVALELDFARLDEMVVVGYGSVRRSDLTGSVDRVDADQFQNQAITQVTDMLSGSVAGFYGQQSTGAAGGSSMQVRGPTSLTAGTEPMVVLDGVVYNGSLSDINPNDIETVDVLKDASAAAIYGARAASGVILLTTSRGSTGEPTINFTTSLGRTAVTRTDYGPRDAQDYVDFRTDYYRTVDTDFPDYHFMDPNNLPDDISIDEWRSTVGSSNADDDVEWLNRLNFYGGEIDNYLSGNSTNWSEEVMPAGLRQNADLSISGGTDNARYYWSVGHVDNEGIIRGDQFSALRTRLNVDFQVAEWLNVGVNAQYSNRDESVVQASLGQMLNVTPFGEVYREDGSLEWFPGGSENASNPLINTFGQDRDRKISSLFGSMFAEVSLPYGITHRVSFQPRMQNLRDYNYWSPETITGGRTYEGGRATRVENNEYEWMVDNLLKWNRQYGVHSFDVTLLHTAEEFRTWETVVTNNTFEPSPALGYSGIQYGDNPDLSSSDERITGDGMMARLNYTLLDRYLFTASVRRDGYSAFGQENPRAIFPAGAVAWDIADEPFFNIDLLNQLKLRLSWGVNGNRDIDPYASLAQLGSNMFYNGTSTEMGVTTSTLANPALRWEETESINVGLDIGLLKGRIDLTLDYYDMTTSSLLVARTLPAITGFSSVTTNIGELGNKGFEATLRTTNVSSRNVNWSSTLNFSLNRNEIKSLFGDTGTYTLAGEQYEGAIPDYGNGWFIGEAIDVVWDYEIEGMWQEEEAAEAAAYNLRPGDVKGRDLNENGTYEELDDKQFIGHTDPRFRMGLRNDVDFLQNFTASLFIRADLGHIQAFPVALAGWSTFDRRSTPNFPYWTPENRSNDWPKLSKNTDAYGGGIMVYKPASFVRIQDLSLAYNLPSRIAQLFQMQSLRIYGSVRNLYSFDNWPAWDPESPEDEDTGTPPGFTPMPRTFTIGLNLSI